MATKLEIVSKEFIKPSSPTSRNLNHYQFSFLDQIQQPDYIPLIFFYENKSCSPNTDKSHISQQLKQSLSDALKIFYPLAGRINGNFSVDCNDSGVLYIEAENVRTLLSQDIENIPMEELHNCYLPLEQFSVLANSIPLAVQTSFFGCGSIAIGVQMSHKVGDVISLVTFLNSWASICRGDFEIIQPKFDFGLQYFPSMQMPEPPFKEVIDSLKKEKIVTKSFVFDEEKLVELKSLVSYPDGSKPMDATRVEVVSAFICKKLIEIIQAKVDPKKLFAIMHVVNLRSRLRKLYQSNEFLFGNFSSISVSALLNMAEKGKELHDLVSEVKNTTRKFNDEHEEDVPNKVVNENIQQFANYGNRETAYYCFFTSWCRFPFDIVDYGWGKPCLIRTKAFPIKNVVVLMDTKSGDGIEALVTLAEEDMAMLPNDFLSLANNDLKK